MSYIYIASPYSHPEAVVREHRYQLVCEYAGKCLEKGEDVFSPIAHTHPISIWHKLPEGWEFWRRIDTAMLRVASRLRVYKMPGWDKSVGVTEEIKLARQLNIPIEYVEFK